MDPINANGLQRVQQAAHALTSALSNPYSNSYSLHYAQAYNAQYASSSNTPLTTPEGYSLSSTSYSPSLSTGPRQFSERNTSMRGGHGNQRARHGEYVPNCGQQRHQTHWFEPGDQRCICEQCTFTGSKKSVEIHMMDRHLIFPPGWDKRKRRADWDTDPSLKGKPIPIQGTNLVLDTPEAINAWIEERKKRWPSASRVEEKDKKLKDAIERGDITASDPILRSRKRPRTDDASHGRGQARGTVMGRGGRGRRGQVSRPTIVYPLPPKPIAAISVNAVTSDDESSSSGSDMDPEKHAVSSKPPSGVVETIIEQETLIEVPEVKEDSQVLSDVPPQPIQPTPRRPVAQPKTARRNPFAKRPSLLHNLLLPEIRMTVSNLSQAIHFLVENDFLQDLELNPGDADNRPIEVVRETKTDMA